MPKLKQIKLKGFSAFLGGIIRFLCEKALLTFFLLLLLALFFSSYIYYKYSVLAERSQPEISGQQIKFDKNNYEEILNIWEERENNFKAIDSKQYPEVFK